MDDEGLDFAVAAWREDGLWQVSQLPPHAAERLEVLVRTLRAQPGEAGALALVSVGDDFFLLVRVGADGVRLLLSDVASAGDWPLAGEALDALGIPVPKLEDVDDGEPAGDLRIFADMGLDPAELDLLCSDLDLYPDEALGSIATRLGFGELFDTALEGLPG